VQVHQAGRDDHTTAIHCLIFRCIIRDFIQQINNYSLMDEKMFPAEKSAGFIYDPGVLE
jgi:hypothetical protein